MAGLRSVIETRGVFCSLYSDRASHFVYTPKGATKPDRTIRTQVGRALEQLGIELIAANSPQARGRCERAYGTLQGRWPQELRQAGVKTMEEANAMLPMLVARHNERFAVNPVEEGTAFVPHGGADLNKIFSKQSERVVSNDNTISIERLRLQIKRQTFRFSMAKCRVLVCDHLDGTLSVHYGPHVLGHYSRKGELLTPAQPGTKERAA
jgi:hypothetical protein